MKFVLYASIEKLCYTNLSILQLHIFDEYFEFCGDFLVVVVSFLSGFCTTSDF